MSGKHGAAADHHILAGLAALAPVGILAALDADAIVAGVKLRVDDEGVLARLQVEGVAILRKGRVAREYLIYYNILICIK